MRTASQVATAAIACQAPEVWCKLLARIALKRWLHSIRAGPSAARLKR